MNILDNMIRIADGKRDLPELAELMFRELPNEGRFKRKVFEDGPFKGATYFWACSYACINENGSYIIVSKDQLKRLSDSHAK